MINKEEGCSHILRNQKLKRRICSQKFTSIEKETGIKKIATIKDNDKL